LGNLSFVLSAYQLELIVSASVSLVTVAAIRLRDWDSGSVNRSPPILRAAIVMFFAVLGSILALRHFGGVECGLALTLFATIALTIIFLERQRLFSMAFISAFLKALMVCLMIWGLVVVVRYFCGDTDLPV
jgi:hypothetical protein